MAGISAYDKIEYGEFKLPSLQEMMIVPEYLTQQHEMTNAELINTQLEAVNVGSSLIPGIDDDLLQQTNAFQQNVDSTIEELGRTGINSTIKSKLIAAKKQYNTNIAPIGVAAQSREAAAAEIDEARIKNPNLIAKDLRSIRLSD